MPIPVQQFPILSPQQANPLGLGLTTGQNLYRQWINNRSLEEANQQTLQGQALANALAKLKLNVAPQTLQTDLDYKQAQIPYLQAQTNRTNQATQLAPLESLIKVQQANQSGSRFGGAYQLSKALSELSPPVRTAWIAEHQGAYNEMLRSLGNKDNPSLLTPNIIKQFFPNAINGNSDNVSLPNQSPSSTGFQAPTDALAANPSQFILQFGNLTNAINLVEKSVNESATPAYNVSRKLDTVTKNGVTYQKRADGGWYPL